MIYWWVTTHSSNDLALVCSLTSKPFVTKYGNLLCPRLGSGILASEPG